MKRIAIGALFLSACGAVQVPAVPPQYAPGDRQHDADALRAAITASADACLRGDVRSAVAIYHPSVILSSPAQPDQSYEQIRASLTRRCNPRAARLAPTFEDIRFNALSALVAVTWTIEPPGHPELASMVRELGYWERTADGWRYMRGVRWDYRPVPPS